MLMPFTSDVIMLAIGFAIGYWMLISADKYENRLNRIGETLAWILIAATAILTIGNLLSTMATMGQKHYTPVNGPNSPGVGQQVLNTGEPQGSTNPIIQQGQPQGIQQNTEETPGSGKPIKNQNSGPMGTP